MYATRATQEKMDVLGEVLLQDSFTVWDPKGLLKKKRDYQIFLFDICILFSKQFKDSNGKNKYQYKFKMNVRYCVFELTSS